MKSNLAISSDVIVSGSQQTGNFTIAANGKAFKILINGLYSNKIQAIVRELSSNAFDSHKQASRSDMPFDLFLPNILDPTFAVRDYGTSLSHENIMGLYTTVFQSTKEDTNNAVGKFGLGSKTPFAYTDSFTVTAFLRGTKRVYGAYMNENDIPQIALMASEDTIELDGLMISFPVNVADYEKYRLETERVLEGFDVKPNVKGNTVNLDERTPFHVGSNFKIYEHRFGNKTIKARQGCVIYPIDSSALGTLTAAQQSVFNTNILIDFPIGELDVTPSRESLSYDKPTIANILAMADRVNAELVADISEKYSKVRTMFEAKVFKTENYSSVIPSISSFIQNLKFEGKPVNSHSSFQRDRLKKNYNVAIKYFDKYKVSQDRSILKFNDSQFTTTWETDIGTMFVMDNADERIVHASARIKNNLDGKTNVVWIRNYGATAKQLRKLRKLLGFPPKIHDIADFELPERKKAVYTSNRIAKNECHVEFYNVTLQELKKDVIDLNQPDPDWVYVIAYKDEILVSETGYRIAIRPYDLPKFFTDLTKVLIMRKQNLPKIIKAGIPNGLEQKRDELFKKIDFNTHFKESCVLEDRMNNRLVDHADVFAKFIYDKDTSFKKMLDLLKIYDKRESYEANDELIRLWQSLVSAQTYRDLKEKVSVVIKPEDTLDHAFKEFKKEYPITHYIFGSSSYRVEMDAKRAKDLFDYVTLIDGTKN